MTAQLNNIALIGRHTEDFLSELKKAGFAPVGFGSVDKVGFLMLQKPFLTLNYYFEAPSGRR